MSDDSFKVHMSRRRALTKTFYAALGRIAVESAHLEDGVRDLFIYLMGTNRAAVIAAGENMSNLLLMCQRIAAFNRSLTDEQITTLGTISSAVTLVYGRRSAALHAQWYPTTRPRYFFGVRSRRAGPPSDPTTAEPLYWTLETTTELADNISTLNDLLDKFTSTLPNYAKTVRPFSRAEEKRMDEWFQRNTPDWYQQMKPSAPPAAT